MKASTARQGVQHWQGESMARVHRHGASAPKRPTRKQRATACWGTASHRFRAVAEVVKQPKPAHPAEIAQERRWRRQVERGSSHGSTRCLIGCAGTRPQRTRASHAHLSHTALSSHSLFFKQEMELTLVGLQNSGKTTLVNVVAVRAHTPPARSQPPRRRWPATAHVWRCTDGRLF